MDYTSRWNNFQFRSPVYLDGHFEKYKFDLVKWEQHEPYEVTDFVTGEKRMSTEKCYTIASLVWDTKESGFKFESYGLRYLEDYCTGLNEWILAFAKMKEIELSTEENL